MKEFTEETYNIMIDALFRRFPSFQKSGAAAYKPGIGNMVFFDQVLGHPHQKYMTIHVAGTNGKGSVSNMLAAVLAASGKKVGLYTSPHILDFRERARIIDGSVLRIQADGALHAGSGTCPGDMSAGVGVCGTGSHVKYISREEVWDFVQKWGETFDHLDLSFFEITTSMAFDWFASQEVDVAVIETGLGGRLDSTNIISPVLSVITNIGLDHCDMLGETLSEIAFEKAGIVKPKVPVVVGESNPETDPVFERKVLYTNISEAEYMGDRTRIMSLLAFADKVEPHLWGCSGEILAAMDLQGIYQRNNLRTVLAAAEVLGKIGVMPSCIWDGGMPEKASAQAVMPDAEMMYAIEHTASIMDFHGRWERLCSEPYVIADIGHNSHGLKYNFAQLGQIMSEGRFDSLTIIYGAMADKDVSEIMHLMPKGAEYVFVTAPGKRAMPADKIMEAYAAAGGDASSVKCFGSVAEGVAYAMGDAMSPGRLAAGEACVAYGSVCADCLGHGTCSGDARRLVYIGGSTYVVSEAVSLLRGLE